MRRFSVLMVGVVALLGMSASSAYGQSEPQVVTTFSSGAFPESLAVDAHGNLYTSLGFLGEVVKISPAGLPQTVATLDVGQGLLTGLAFDVGGRLYVADATFAASPAPGIFRIDSSGSATRVATFPPTSFPNGLAFHGRYLYVSDSSLGAIWRISAGGQTAIWLQSPLLAPKNHIGANGIAFWQGSLFVAVADSGTILRVPLTSGGGPGAPEVFAQGNELRTADGIAFDADGNLYVAVNDNRLVRLSPDGTPTLLGAKNDGFVYPTMPAFGTTSATSTTLFVANGALYNGSPNIVAVDVGIAGLRLP